MVVMPNPFGRMRPMPLVEKFHLPGRADRRGLELDEITVIQLGRWLFGIEKGPAGAKGRSSIVTFIRTGNDGRVDGRFEVGRIQSGHVVETLEQELAAECGGGIAW